MNTFAKALLMILCIDFILFGVMIALEDTPGNTTITGGGGSLYQAGSNYSIKNIDEQGLQNLMPGSSGSVTEEGGNIFTDMIKSVKNWFLDITGIGYALDIINAMPRFLSMISLPQPIIWGLGAIWHIFTIFLLIMLVWGRT